MKSHDDNVYSRLTRCNFQDRCDREEWLEPNIRSASRQGGRVGLRFGRVNRHCQKLMFKASGKTVEV